MKRHLFAWTTALALSLSSLNAKAAEPLTVLLDWFINPDHAHLIIAETNGIFDRYGLDVTLVEPTDPNAPPRLVAAGQAPLAISYQPQLHMQVDQGLPLIRIGTVVSTPLNSLVVLRDGPIKSLSDLRGKKVGYSVGGFEEAVLGAMLKTVDLSLTDVELINVNFSLSPSLVAGQVDAVIGAFRNFELNQMDIINAPGTAYYPEEHGVPVYDELIIVARKDNLDDPRFKPFMAALEEAIQYTLNHPEEAWQKFAAYKPGLDDELNRRAWRDTLPRLTLRPSASDAARYDRFAEFLAADGLIREALPANQYTTELP